MKPHFPLQCPMCQASLTATQSLQIIVKVPTDSTHPPVLQTFRAHLDHHGFLDSVSSAAVKGLVAGGMPTSWCRCGSCNAELKSVWPPPRSQVEWGHRYTTTTCPECSANWQDDDSVIVEIGNEDHGPEYLESSLDENGILQDVGEDEDEIKKGNMDAATCTNCGFEMDVVEDKTYQVPGSWVNSRGLDAEVLLNIAEFFDNNLWIHHPARIGHSMLEYQDVIYTVCTAFQQRFATTNWDDVDFWEIIDTYVGPLARLAKGDPDLMSWSVESILAEFAKL